MIHTVLQLLLLMKQTKMHSFFSPDFEQAEVLLVVPGHEGTMLLCLLPRPLLCLGARLFLVLFSQHLLLKLQTERGKSQVTSVHQLKFKTF